MTSSVPHAGAPGNGGRKYLWYDTTNRMRIAAGRQRVPLIGTFELTARCNLGCRMCLVRRDAGDRDAAAREPSAEAWIGMATQARDHGLLFLLLTGGEPLLRPDFWRMYEAFTGMGFVLTLYTNGTLVGDAEAERFGRSPPGRVLVTLYGASPETYEAVCGNAAAFDRTVAGVRRLKEAGVNVQVRATVCRENVSDLDAMDAIARDLTGRDRIETSMMLSPPVRGAATDAAGLRLSPEEMVGLQRRDVACDPEADGSATAVSEILTSASVGRPSLNAPVRIPPMFCSGGRGSFWLAWDGRMLPCALMHHPFARPFETGFASAWKDLVAATGRIPGADACQDCAHRPFCSVCPGRLQAETGDFTRLSPHVCRTAELIHSMADARQ